MNKASSQKRVVVTGIGVVSPLGNDLARFSENLLNGVSGAGAITVFDPAHLPTRIAAQSQLSEQVLDPELKQGIKDRKILFALVAAQNAMNDSAIRVSMPLQDYQSGLLSIGLGLELFSMPDMVAYLENETDGNLTGSGHELCYLQTPSDICVHMLAKQYSIQTVPQIHISACSASTDAIGNAFRNIKYGLNRWALAGGTDSMINPLGVAGFCKLNALTTQNDKPQQASRPFDLKRDGFLLGEGAAFFVLESLASAISRNAKIYAEICGYGNSFDAHGISEPHPQGDGAVLAMKSALQDAQVDAGAVSYINAHGTSTPKNDVVETLAIKRLFGKHAHKLKISAGKSMFGHLISAAGAVESAAMLVCAQKGRMHATINLTNSDAACDLDYVAYGSELIPDGYWLKNSFGFGGQNAALLFAPAPGY